MKVNIPVRLRNPWFWVGVISVALAATGIDVETLTSWPNVLTSVLDVISNPLQLAAVVLAVLAIFIDPTTAGIGDSLQALTYIKPRKDEPYED